MARGVRTVIKLDLEEQQALEKIVRQQITPQHFAARAEIILCCANKMPRKEIAKMLRISTTKVTKWSQRWVELKANGISILKRLGDLPRSGKPSHITPEQLCRLVAMACESPSNYVRPITAWTHRELADEAIKQGVFESISPSHLGRLLAEMDLRPHKSQYWLTNKNDPKREEKIAAICQVYSEAETLKEKNIVTISVDEMTGIQALERCEPTLPMRPGSPEKIEYEYKRNGTQCLLAGLDVATGKAFALCQDHRKEEDFCNLIKALENQNPNYLQLRIVVDNLNTHQSASLVEYVAKRSGYQEDLGTKGTQGILKSQESRAAFLSKAENKIVFYYTPKHASWMNQIEVWFGTIAKKVIKRGNFSSTDDLKQKLLDFIRYFNETMAAPYNWSYKGGVLKT